jgi:Family of unknown function (DUF6184)
MQTPCGMKRGIHCGVTLGVLGLLSVVGCSHGQVSSGPSSPQAATTIDPMLSPPDLPPLEAGPPDAALAEDVDVIHELSSARCDREQACGRIGRLAEYASRDDCMGRMVANLMQDVTATHCARGIDRDSATQCMAAIRQDRCGDPGETMARVGICAPSTLCIP